MTGLKLIPRPGQRHKPLFQPWQTDWKKVMCRILRRKKFSLRIITPFGDKIDPKQVKRDFLLDIDGVTGMILAQNGCLTLD